ncbi:ceramide glucosyltransferase [Mesobacterium sp. TK19101]|uniref:Ceramide glucosyltransferase n=1 Tax=Mesobacterium hydrothermale TaxID=3111907 RepID=A0ABU6HKX1_9RHOB|nr:ceramide glucosyltransferase [Mesobacterium sp. TK19101]MEC3863103.1 ceramide glucosyltransferase [Mesobacterium sp. TK19101]
MLYLAGLALTMSTGLLLVHLISIGLALPRLKKSRPDCPPPVAAPRVTVLRPFKGLEYRLEETLGSSLTLDYPDYQVFFCVDDANDPAVPLVRRLIDAHPDVEAKLLIGRDTGGRNPKINNLMKGWRAADGAYVAMADSNIILPPDYLSQLVSRWDDTTGLVSSPAAGIDPRNFGGAVECAFLNGYQARWQAAADQLGMGYAQGKTLFWNRDFLDQRGGPQALGDAIAEDAASTILVRGAGLRVRLTRAPFDQPIGARRFATIWKRQVRWAIIRRVAFPGLFLGEPLTSAALPLLLFLFGIAALGMSLWLGLLFAALWYGAEWGLTRVAGWPLSLEIIAASLCRDAMIPLLWGIAWTRSSFDWKGNTVGAPGGGQP